MKSIQVVAFDLDDTLLRLAPDFVAQYIRVLDESLDETFPHLKPFSNAIMTSTVAMMQKLRDDERLEDFFYRDFAHRTGLTRAQLEPHFNRFYQDQFRRMAELAWPNYGVMGLLTLLQEHGYKIALLTSPLFPRVAIDVRLEWAGLEGFPFDWRTSFEAVHATKPQPGYYEEAADGLGIAPEHWLMVGNDLIEDIQPAHQAGMSVYWIHGEVTPEEMEAVPPDTIVGPLERVVQHLLG